MSIDPITIDFETEAINGNPIIHPPRAVGVAIWDRGSEPTYLAWGHPSGNNCTEGDGISRLESILYGSRPLLFHNAGFDVSVLNRLIGSNWLDWERIHDTMYLLFLADPYAATLSLKPSADRYLGMRPDEQSNLHDWIVANVAGATRKNAGAFISRAPADLVTPYAIGDVVRTRGLFDLLHDKIVTDGMEPAYDRERRLFPIVYRGTQRGIRIDRDTLSYHEYVYGKCLSIAEGRLVTALGGNPDVLERDSVLCDALDKIGAVKEWTLTATGKRSMAKGNLKIADPNIKMLMEYRGALSTCLQTFMRPWLALSERDGRLHPNWNQVKQYREGGGIDSKKGTQTGRLSSDSPNFQNIPAEFTYKDGTAFAFPSGLHPLPIMRSYCLPEPGHLWLKRDFSSQEIRILAHFEDGSLCQAYRDNVDLDPHQMAMDLIHKMVGILYARKSVKITGFSIIYGTGANGLSLQLECPYLEAKTLKDAYLDAMPGVRDLMQSVQRRGQSGQSVRTWGGRVYYTEPSKVIDGRLRDFAYKLLNYLIQGSAADQTKQSIIDWDDTRGVDDVFLATVHDEINTSAPVAVYKKSMDVLKAAMEHDRFDVPFASEGFVGPNWAEMKVTDKPGRVESVDKAPVDIKSYNQKPGGNNKAPMK